MESDSSSPGLSKGRGARAVVLSVALAIRVVVHVIHVFSIPI